jgi:L-asparagine oxygenase
MDHVLELDNNEIDTLINFASILDFGQLQVHFSESEATEIFCDRCKKLARCLPQRIIDKLMHFKKNGSETGFLLIKTLPIDNVPETPPGNNYKVGEKTPLASIQSMLMHVIGDVIAYEAEGYGRIFQDVVPIQSMATIQTSLGSNTELEIHTEQAFSKLRPDILSLACLRGDYSAYTYILPVQRIIDNLSTEEIELLHKPLWETGVDLSFKLNGHEFIEGDVRGPMPILNNGNLVFDQDLMSGITEEAEQLVHKIVDIYYKHRIEHNLQPGEIILIDNNRAVHGRSPFFPKFDGKDRFLIRCFSTFDYEKSGYARTDSSRVVSAIYS